MPRETSFFDFFEQHMTVTVAGAREFLALTAEDGYLPDRRKRIAMAQLFEHEQDLRTLIKWKDVYVSLENAIDRCEDVANIIEGVVLEHA